MRLILGLAAALLACSASAATQQGADVYILQADSHSSPSSPPRLSREVARHILLQRAAGERYGMSQDDLLDLGDHETVISQLNMYGSAPAPLFGAAEARKPSQLVMILQGVDAKIVKQLGAALKGYSPAFVVSDPPSYAANDGLILDFDSIGVPKQPDTCAPNAVFNPFESTCWKWSSSVVRYDLNKRPAMLEDVIKAIPLLKKYVKAGELEAALLLHPESSRSSPLDSWARSSPSDLRRRAAEFEEPISDGALSSPSSSSSSNNNNNKHTPAFPAAATKSIPPCFPSYNSCVSATDNCTGHGLCADKPWNHTSAKNCFSCTCLASVQNGSTTHWAGAVCQKQDVSTPFWLIAGFTVAIVWAVAFAVGLLYSVGEEKLPGVIGAGVSRTK